MGGDGHASIIIDPDILRETYIPDKLKARQAQKEQILSCLSPVAARHKPIHTWLHGKPGTGKTTTAIHALRTLEEKSRVRTVIVNCWEKPSFYQILNAMVREFRVLRAEENRASFKLEKLRLFLNGHPLVVLLDEIDRIRPRELSTVLYNLDSVLNAGLICISDSTRALTGLAERVRSRINPHTIFFPSYSRTELMEILTDRAGTAFADHCWSQAALRQIAGVTQGDARAAIRMLHRAAVTAEQQHLERITTDSLRAQLEAAREARKTSVLNSLTRDHRMLYEIVRHSRRILSRDLWQKYLQHCERIRRKPLACRTFSDYCNTLADGGLITSERARVRGKVRLFKVLARVS